ncbi:type III PLP-dependent enzyme [Aureimonas leprariae]|uniref:Type III PLP-dependent enzyme n=1 Tax=Plantimonas leprariae TaxID=2615207 RepID=A0A7V7PM81_9HYPH|nr:type III PLP-dependent enzyme [Aureimonas leprariae]KAB0677741.1 type III PLP-dependent enzyme [Aureimonas leprariae]
MSAIKAMQDRVRDAHATPLPAAATTPEPARRTDPPLPTYASVDAMIAELKPTEPVFCFLPDEMKAAARRFRGLPGRVLYAVKCNPHPFALRTLFEAGIRDFDVASLEEVKLIDSLFGKAAGQFFNNPAKSRPAIRAASRDFGIRFYTVDCAAEVDKILDETRGGDDLIIAVRLATHSRDARYALSTKFGASPAEAAELLQRIDRRGVKAGISFHVGSQCLSPDAFGAALDLSGKVARKAGVALSVMNVGGGFPAPYPGDDPAPLERYFAEVIYGHRKLGLSSSCMLMCEPGRSLVASAGRVVAQVTVRRDRTLFINDGVFGALQELGHPKERRPVRLVRADGAATTTTRTAEFRIYGPTCDSNDVLGAPFVLPDDVREGDWLEIGLMGAYSLSMRTHFNGFFLDRVVSIEG